MKKKLYSVLILVLLIGAFIHKDITVLANETETTTTTTSVGTKVILDMDYTTGIIKVSAGPSGSNKLYISTDRKKTWELIETGGTLDLTGLMKTSAVTLYFKGNKDTEPVEFTIPAEDKELKVTYSVENAKGIIIYTLPVATLQYRVGTNENWRDVPITGSISTTYYEITGATLQFRKKATKTTRAGKIVALKIPRRPKAPTIKVDGSKLEVTGLKSGLIQYRLGTSTDWKLFAPTDSKTKTMTLASLLYTTQVPANTILPAATLEFRTIPQKKSPASAILTIELDTQRAAPTASTVKLEGTTLTILDASTQNPYEYLVVQAGYEPDLSKDKWKAITNNKPLIIRKVGTAEVLPGDKIYVRYKSVKEKETGKEKIASLYSLLTITTLTPAKPTPTAKPSPTPKTTPTTDPSPT